MRDVEDERDRLYPKHGDKHQLLCAPLITRLSRELSTLYIQSPGRTFEGLTPDAAARAQRVYESMSVNDVMRESQQTLVALNQAVIWVLPVPTIAGARCVLVPPHEQTVRMADPTSHDERDVGEWYLRMPVAQNDLDGSLSWATACITPTKAIYTDGPGELKGTGVWAEDGSNPLGFIPAVRLKGTIPAMGEFWCPVPEDLLAAARAISMNLSDMALLARMQGHGQAVVTGLPMASAKEIEIGSEVIVGLMDPDADFKYVQANPHLGDYKTITQYYLDTVVALNGLSPASVLKSSAITALAKRLEMLDRDVERRRMAHEFVRAEQLIYKAVAGWVNWQRGVEVLAPDAKVSVQFREPALVVDALHEQQAVDLRIASGMSTAAQELARIEGISEEEATARVKRNIEATAALARSLAAAGVGPDEAAAAVGAESPEGQP